VLSGCAGSVTSIGNLVLAASATEQQGSFGGFGSWEVSREFMTDGAGPPKSDRVGTGVHRCSPCRTGNDGYHCLIRDFRGEIPRKSIVRRGAAGDAE